MRSTKAHLLLAHACMHILAPKEVSSRAQVSYPTGLVIWMVYICAWERVCGLYCMYQRGGIFSSKITLMAFNFCNFYSFYACIQILHDHD